MCEWDFVGGLVYAQETDKNVTGSHNPKDKYQNKEFKSQTGVFVINADCHLKYSQV